MGNLLKPRVAGASKTTRCGVLDCRHDIENGDAECELESLLEKKDKKFRELGLWAFDTLNANAWPAASEYLKLTSAAFVLIQESKLAEGQPIDEAEQAAETAAAQPRPRGKRAASAERTGAERARTLQIPQGRPVGQVGIASGFA